MVKLHIKRGEESLFLYETTVEAPLSEVVVQLVRLQNGRLKVSRLCQGMHEDSTCNSMLFSDCIMLLSKMAWQMS